MGPTALIHHDVYSPTPFSYHLCFDLFHFPITFSLGSFPLFRHIYNRTRSWRKKKGSRVGMDLELIVIFCLLFLFLPWGHFLPSHAVAASFLSSPFPWPHFEQSLDHCHSPPLPHFFPDARGGGCCFNGSARTLPSWSLTPYSGVRGNHGLEIDTTVE